MQIMELIIIKQFFLLTVIFEDLKSERIKLIFLILFLYFFIMEVGVNGGKYNLLASDINSVKYL